MIEKVEKIWLDGKWVNWDDANVHILSHTLHYGYGAFEGIRSYLRKDGKSAIFRLDEHIDRLFNSCHLLELKIPFSKEVIKNACIEALKLNKLKEGYIRPIVFIGEKEVGLYPGDNPDVRVGIIVWKWGAYLGEEALTKGVRVKCSTWTKFHINSVLIKGKITGHYVNGVLAKIEAKREGYGEAILLDHLGYVAEGSGENIFIVKNGALYTPPPYATILSGITRDTIITMAKEMGIPVYETTLTRNDLYLADEVFFCGTASEVSPIREIDRHIIGNGEIGHLTKKIQDYFFDVVMGKIPQYNHWMTFYEI